MPILEAPLDLNNESSPEVSLNQEPAMPQGDIPFIPVAEAQVRLPTPHPFIQIREDELQQNNASYERNWHLPRLYDHDIIEAEEENHIPAYVNLLPVVLPPQIPEPTLDELLRRVTARNDLHNVETVRLRVISYTLSLSHLPLFLPRLQHLDLSGSVLCTLRDLGFGFIHLSYLNVSNCGLNSFDGTSGFPALRVLIADDNMIQRISPLADLTLLQHLSIRNNRISELSILTFLGLCSNLMEVQLQGNPVQHQNFYRQTLQRSIPTLKILDGLAMQNEVSTVNTLSSLDSENISSLSSSSYSNNSDRHNEDQRPTTAPILHCDNSNNNADFTALRAHSVSPNSRCNSLSSGSPVAGSVVSFFRQKQRHKRHIGKAWVSSDSSMHLSTSSNHSTRPPSSISSSDSYDCMSATQAARVNNDFKIS